MLPLRNARSSRDALSGSVGRFGRSTILPTPVSAPRARMLEATTVRVPVVPEARMKPSKVWWLTASASAGAVTSVGRAMARTVTAVRASVEIMRCLRLRVSGSGVMCASGVRILWTARRTGPGSPVGPGGDNENRGGDSQDEGGADLVIGGGREHVAGDRLAEVEAGVHHDGHEDTRPGVVENPRDEERETHQGRRERN